MKITENERAISTAERQYLLYRFLLENSNKDMRPRATGAIKSKSRKRSVDSI